MFLNCKKYIIQDIVLNIKFDYDFNIAKFKLNPYLENIIKENFNRKSSL